MIRIVREPEPATLRTAAAKRLQKAEALFHAVGIAGDGFGDALEGYNLQAVRKTLYRQQNRRCAFCERPIGREGNNIEHFRTKGGALRGEQLDAERYWWLCWDWNNLFLACPTCNSPGRKGNHFDLRSAPAPCPVRGQSQGIGPITFPVDIEQPLFLDPCREEPTPHFRWFPLEETIAPKKWTWTVVGATERGQYCIDRFDLTEVAESATEAWGYVHALLVQHDLFRRETPIDPGHWQAIQADLFAPNAAFPGARYGMLCWCHQQLPALSALPAPSVPVSQTL